MLNQRVLDDIGCILRQPPNFGHSFEILRSDQNGDTKKQSTNGPKAAPRPFAPLPGCRKGHVGWVQSDDAMVTVNFSRIWVWWVFSMNKPRIRNFPRMRNKESETKTREPETKICESETKICESETKNRANQKLKYRNQIQNPTNQKLRIRN